MKTKKYPELNKLLPKKYGFRTNQRELVEKMIDTISQDGVFLVNAPTGMGKTLSVLMASKYANRQVIYVTPVTSQHDIVIKNMKDLGDDRVIALIGKEKMCINKKIKESSNFYKACQKSDCPYRMFIKKEIKGREVVTARDDEVVGTHETPIFIEKCREQNQCPYDTACMRIPHSKVVLANYLHVFDPKISARFYLKAKIDPSEWMIVIDESHNLPNKLRDIGSRNLSQFSVEKAITELKDFNEATSTSEKTDRVTLDPVEINLERLNKNLQRESVGGDVLLAKHDVIFDCDLSQFRMRGLEIEAWEKKENNDQAYTSWVSKIADFFEDWLDLNDSSYVRILNRKFMKRGASLIKYYNLKVMSLDPRYLASKLTDFNSAVLMSGTLKPTFYFKKILGLNDADEEVFPSIFPKENKRIHIHTDVTTRSAMRTPEMFDRYAKKINEVCKETEGNVAVFFTSKAMLDQIGRSKVTTKGIKQKVITEHDEDTIESIHKHMAKGNKLLMGWVRGRLHEGVDYKNDALQAIIIVGFPFPAITLESQALQEYIGKANGFKYACLLPTVNVILQTMGRGIRSNTDKCDIHLMDGRYASNYRRYFDFSDGELYVNGVKYNG